MLQNPIAQTLGLFVGAYMLLTFAQKLHPADTVITVAAGLFVVILWMLRFNRSQLYMFYRNPVAGPVIDLVCKVSKEQPPVDASVDQPAPSNRAQDQEREAAPAQAAASSILLATSADFADAGRTLKQSTIGHDEAIDGILAQLYRNVQLRDSSSRDVSLPPLGVFLLVGRAGLGKRRVASAISRLLYRSGAVVTIDLAEDPAATDLLPAVKANPYSGVILENLTSASPQTMASLRSLVAGAPLIETSTGAKVSFRHCVFFLLIHSDASALPKQQRASGPGTGQTVMVGALKSTLNLDEQLAWALHGSYPFLLPPQIDQARVIALLMQEECSKYGLRLGRVDPVYLAREVEVTAAQGGFQLAPSRIRKILHDRILAARESGSEYIELSDESGEESPRKARYQR
jgi:hypothetical protein